MRSARGVILLGFSLLLLFHPSESGAQTACEDSDTYETCLDRLIDGRVVTYDPPAEVNDTIRADARWQVALKLFAKTTGLGGGIGGLLGSAIENYLPLFAGSAAIDREDPEEGVLSGFDLNLPAYRTGEPLQPPDLGGKLRLRVELRDPSPFAPLLESTPSEGRAALEERVERELNDLDDVSLSMSWNRESRSFGRAAWANATVLDGLFSSLLGTIPSPTDSYVIDEWLERIEADVEAAGTAGEAGCSDWDDFQIQMRCLTPDFRAEYEGALRQYARVLTDYEGAVDSLLTSSGFFRIADLINNQPQLSVSAKARLRDDLVGPREYDVVVRYENGWANLNGLRDYCRDSVTADCYRRYLDGPGVKAALARSDRFFVSAAARWVEEYDFESPGPEGPPDLALDGSFTFAGEAGYGRYVSVNEAGEELARFDFSAKVTRNDSASGRNDTWGVAAIYTHRVSDSFSLPVGVTYSNQDEFLDDVDHRVSANVGLHYRLIPTGGS